MAEPSEEPELREESKPAGIIGATIGRQLADEILAGAFSVDERLDETELAERLGVARTLMRETARQLAAAGLVKLRPRHSTVVAAADPIQIGRLYEMAAELEALAAGWTAMRANLVERLTLIDPNNSCAAAITEADAVAFAAADQAFHDRIATLSQNDSLAAATRHMRDRIAPFQRLHCQSAEEQRVSHGDHLTILVAINGGDSAAAQRAMRNHIPRSSSSAVRGLTRQPTPQD